MRTVPANDHFRRIHWTFIVFYQEAPLHSTAAKGNSTNRSRTTSQARTNPGNPTQPITTSVNRPTEPALAPFTPHRFLPTLGRQTVPLCKKLAADNFRSLGPPGGARLSNRMDQDPTPGSPSNYFSNIQGDLSANECRSGEPPSKTGSNGGTSMPGPIYQSSFSSREKGWVLPAGSQLETIEFLNLFERNISRWKVPV